MRRLCLASSEAGFPLALLAAMMSCYLLIHTGTNASTWLAV